MKQHIKSHQWQHWSRISFLPFKLLSFNGIHNRQNLQSVEKTPLRLGLHQIQDHKALKPSDHIDQEYNLGANEFTLGLSPRYERIMKWHHSHTNPKGAHSKTNTTPTLRNQTSSLGPILSLKIMSKSRGVLETKFSGNVNTPKWLLLLMTKWLPATTGYGKLTYIDICNEVAFANLYPCKLP